MVEPINGTMDAYGIPTPATESGITKTLLYNPAGTPTESCNVWGARYLKAGVARNTAPGQLGCSDPSIAGQKFRGVVNYLIMQDWLAIGKPGKDINGSGGYPFSSSLWVNGSISGNILTVNNTAGANNPRAISVIIEMVEGVPVVAGGAITPGRTEVIGTDGSRALIVSMGSSDTDTTIYTLSRALPDMSGAIMLCAEIGDQIGVPLMLPGRRLYAADGTWMLDGCVNDRRDWNNSIGNATDVLGVKIENGRHWYCRQLWQTGVLVATYPTDATPCRQTACPYWAAVTYPDIWKPNVGDWLKIWLGKGLAIVQEQPSVPDVYLRWGAEKFPGLIWQCGMHLAHTQGMMRERETPWSGYWGYLRDRTVGEENYPFKQFVNGAVAGVMVATGGIAGVLEQTPANPPQGTVDGEAWADGTDAALAHLTTLAGIRELGSTGGFMSDGAGGDCESRVQRPIPFDVVLRGIDLSAGAVDTVQTFFRGHKAIHRASGAVEIYLARETAGGACSATVSSGSVAAGILTLDLKPGIATAEYIAGMEQQHVHYLQGGLSVNPPQVKKPTNPMAFQNMGTTTDLFRRGYVCWFPGLTGGLEHIRLPVVTAQAYGGAAFSGDIGSPPVNSATSHQGPGFSTDPLFADYRLNMDRLTLDLSGAHFAGPEFTAAWAAVVATNFAGLEIDGTMAGLLAPGRGGELTVKHLTRTGLKTVLSSAAIAFEVDESNSDTANGLWTLRVDATGWDPDVTHDIRIAGTRLDMRPSFPAELLTGLEAAVRMLDTMAGGFTTGSVVHLIREYDFPFGNVDSFSSLRELCYGSEPEYTPWFYDAYPRGTGGVYGASLMMMAGGVVWYAEVPALPITDASLGGLTSSLIANTHHNVSFSSALAQRTTESFIDGEQQTETIVAIENPDSLNMAMGLSVLTIVDGVCTESEELAVVPLTGLTVITEGETVTWAGTIESKAILDALLSHPLGPNEMFFFLPTALNTGVLNDPIDEASPFVECSGTFDESRYLTGSIVTDRFSFSAFSIGGGTITIDQNAVAAAAPRQTEPWPNLVNAE